MRTPPDLVDEKSNRMTRVAVNCDQRLPLTTKYGASRPHQTPQKCVRSFGHCLPLLWSSLDARCFGHHVFIIGKIWWAPEVVFDNVRVERAARILFVAEATDARVFAVDSDPHVPRLVRHVPADPSKP